MKTFKTITKKIYFPLFMALLFIVVVSCNDDDKDSNQSPSCNISYPNLGDKFEKGHEIIISAEANDPDGSISELRYYIDNSDMGSVKEPPYEYHWNTSETDTGHHVIEVVAKDDKENTSTSKISITLLEKLVVKDIDGNSYNTITIGKQVWMKNNLRTTTYNDGASIDLVTDDSQWRDNNAGAFCWYGNHEPTYGGTYGALYNWHAVGSGKLCPEGWHVPSHEEWAILENYINSQGYSEVGTALKSSYGWDYDGNGNDAFNFEGLPAGYRHPNTGFFYFVKEGAFWWTSSEQSDDLAWSRSTSHNSNQLQKTSTFKNYGFSVRCIRDR